MFGSNNRNAILLILTLFSAGCSKPPLDYVEVKRIDEQLTDAEVRSFLRVVQGLPDGKLPAFPAVYAPPPNWAEDRTLAVSELVVVEQRAISERWEIDTLVRPLEKNVLLKQLLKEEQMTLEQFAGLYLAIGMSLSRGSLEEDTNFSALEQQGRQFVSRLSEDPRPFSSLSLDVQYYVLQQASWMVRSDRARQLNRVPPENVVLVSKYLEELQPIFPEEFTTDPLKPLVNEFKKQGIPFEILSGENNDADIRWSPRDGILGMDAPDAEFTSPVSTRP